MSLWPGPLKTRATQAHHSGSFYFILKCGKDEEGIDFLSEEAKREMSKGMTSSLNSSYGGIFKFQNVQYVLKEHHTGCFWQIFLKVFILDLVNCILKKYVRGWCLLTLTFVRGAGAS